MGRAVVIGVGNEYRGDDGFGPRVIGRLRRLRTADPARFRPDLVLCDGEPTFLIDRWAGADLAVVVDVARADGHRTGERFEVVLGADGLPVSTAVSSHGIGLGETVALARALDRLPGRLVVLAVAGRRFDFGVGLSPAVAAAVAPVARRARHWVDSC